MNSIIIAIPIIVTIFVIIGFFWIQKKNKEDRDFINQNMVKKCEKCGHNMVFKGRNWVCPQCNHKIKA